MKYQLTGIDQHDVGRTQLLLKDKVFAELAVISWNKAEKSRLFLNPANLPQVATPVADNIDVLPSDALPVFAPDELETVIQTVKHQTNTIQAQNRVVLTYLSQEVRSVRSVADLVLKAVVSPGEKTDHGLLIEAVTVPWFEIIELLKKNPNLAFEIPARKWEEIIAGAYKKAGFDEVTLTPPSGDLGRDVIAVKRGLGIVRVIDQVKAYKPGHLVTANDARALFGVVNADQASKGFLTTTSDFAPKLRDDELLKPFIPARIELINGKELLKRLEELARGKR